MDSLAVSILGPEEGKEEPKEGDEYETVAAEIVLGVNERKPALVAKGLKAFFAMCDAAPHEEGEHLGE